MPRVSDTYPELGEFFKSENITSTLKLTISLVETNVLNDEDAIVLSFQESPKKLRLNKTNAITLSEAWGDEAEEWNGRALELFTIPVMFNGKRTKGMRVRVRE